MNIEIIPVTAFQQNCSLIWDDEKNAAIIDPGGNAEKLIQRIEELELNLKAVLLTHGHLDHVGAAEAIRDHFNIKIWGSQEEDGFLFESLPQQSQQFGLPYISAFTPDRWFNQEGEKIQIGAFTFEILHLPGHTPGHIGFIEHEKNIAFRINDGCLHGLKCPNHVQNRIFRRIGLSNDRRRYGQESGKQQRFGGCLSGRCQYSAVDETR